MTNHLTKNKLIKYLKNLVINTLLYLTLIPMAAYGITMMQIDTPEEPQD